MNGLYVKTMYFLCSILLPLTVICECVLKLATQTSELKSEIAKMKNTLQKINMQLQKKYYHRWK